MLSNQQEALQAWETFARDVVYLVFPLTIHAGN
jgi:hypothetical protein